MNGADFVIDPRETGFVRIDLEVLFGNRRPLVLEIGSDVTLFNPGDEVWYAGSIVRPGTNSELHLVDERIVGQKPKSIGHAQAAAMPLTSITAWILQKKPCAKPYLI